MPSRRTISTLAVLACCSCSTDTDLSAQELDLSTHGLGQLDGGVAAASSEAEEDDSNGEDVVPTEIRGPGGRRFEIEVIERRNLDHRAGVTFTGDGAFEVDPIVAFETPMRRHTSVADMDLPSPADKVGNILGSRLRGASNNEPIEVAVAFLSKARMGPAPTPVRGKPLSDPENQSIAVAAKRQIDQVVRRRREDRSAVMGLIASYGRPILRESLLGNSIRVRLTTPEIQELAEHPDVVSISVADVLTVPPNVQWGRNALGSDQWRFVGFDGANPSLYVGLIDTGVRPSVVGFLGPQGGSLGTLRDCVYGDSHCDDSGNSLFDPTDAFRGHGTGAANIIMGGNAAAIGFPAWAGLSGISRVQLNSYNTFTHGSLFLGGTSASAVEDAIDEAVTSLNSIIVANVQLIGNAGSPASLAADDAFDLDRAVLGAQGNTGWLDAAKTIMHTGPASPGNAHKALGIGAYDAVSNATINQVNFDAADGRFKPDVQFPSNVHTASSHTGGSTPSTIPSDTTKFLNYAGTSGATAHAGGTAAVVWDLFEQVGMSTKPGILYATLIALGDRFGPSNSVGAGRARLPGITCGTIKTGKRTFSGSANQFISVPVPASRTNLRVVTWWPEELTDPHAKIKLQVLDPSGNVVDASSRTTTVFQMAGQSGNAAGGTWKIKLDPAGSIPQRTVYWALVADC